VVAFNRRLVVRKPYVINPYHPILFGQQLFIIVNQDSTGRELYEEVWMKVRFLLEVANQSHHQDRSILWWTQEDLEEILDEEK